MSEQKGWIKLHKKLLNSAVWSDNQRLKAWIHILLSANYEDKEWFANGRLIQIKRGQFVTSNRKLQEAWGCSTNTVSGILKQFAEMGMIKVECPNKKYTLITVVKYSDYQDKVYTDGDSDRDTDRDIDVDINRDTYRDTDRVQLKNNIELSKNDYKNDQRTKEGVPPVFDPGGYEVEE